MTGTQTLVGESANTFTYKFVKKDADEEPQTTSDNAITMLEERIVLAAEATDLADNYNVTKNEGTLKVTEEDILAGEVKNEVTVKFSGEDTAEPEGPNSHATIEKKVVNEKDSYTEGDTPARQLILTVSLRSIRVKSLLRSTSLRMSLKKSMTSRRPVILPIWDRGLL